MSSKVRSVTYDPRPWSGAPPGRWEQLFSDLEAQLAAGRDAEQRWDLVELTRAERARIALRDRLRASVGRELRIGLAPGETVAGVVSEVTAEWLLLDVGAGRRALVPTAAVGTVDGLGPYVAPPAGRVESSLGLGHALRALARDRVAVSARTRVGVVAGRLERVGADHVDVTLAAPAGRVVSVAFATLLAVVST